MAHLEQRPEGEGGYLLVEEDTTDSSLFITMDDRQVEAARRKAVRKRKTMLSEEEEKERGGASESEEEERGVALEIDRRLDQSLETKSKQHNLTTVNVRNILHEVITNEHVVAMMKAAINETDAVPPFEPKMTRSKFKEVVERGVVIPAWNISPIKKSTDTNKAPQFMDIPLAEEDSSDEEYHPDEDDDDETAEDTFQESDMESTASSPRGSRLNRGDEDTCSPWQTSRRQARRLRAGPVSMGPPPPPKAPPTKPVTDSSFLEKLHAVEEELAVCMEPYQPLSESEDEAGLMAYRTRSKRPLRDIPLGRLEAELRAPDITPDMYDSSSAHEDREWTDWLRGLMTSDVDNEEECDDEDDPEYNFLADTDEPDLEDYRDDKAVRITKKEVNELMEELFETLKEDLVGQEVDDEGHEEEEEPHIVQTHTLEEQSNTGPADDEAEDEPITELRTVKQQLAFIRRRHTHTLNYTHTPEPHTHTHKHTPEPHTLNYTHTHKHTPEPHTLNYTHTHKHTPEPHTLNYTHTHKHTPEPHTLRVNTQQRRHLEQQLQQHVQLLLQVQVLTCPAGLQSEAETCRHFLFELNVLAQRAELIRSDGHPGFCSAFRASNLQGALQLLEELRQTPISYRPQLHPPDARGYMRSFPILPAELSWIFSTRPVFLHPELLPCCSLDPALYCPRRTAAFTAAEDCLLVLGLRNMEGSCDPPKLVSQFLLRKTLVQVRRRILQCCRPGFPDNVVKTFRYQRLLRSMPVACRRVDPAEQRPPVEREESLMPLWLLRSLPIIYLTVKHYNSLPGSAPEAPPPCRWGGAVLRSAFSTYSFPPGTRYPPRLPDHLDFRRIGFVLKPLPTPLPESASSGSPGPGAVSPPRLLLTRTDTASFTVSTATSEQIRCYCEMLAGLRRKRRRLSSSLTAGKHILYGGGATRSDDDTTATPPRQGSASSQVVGDDVIRTSDEEEEEGDVLLALSESSPSATGSVAHDDSLEEAELERGQEVTPLRASENEGGGTSSGSRASVLRLQEQQTGGDEDEGGDDDDEEDRRESEDMLFAQDYLHRVCEAVQVCPGLLDQLLQVLDGSGSVPEVLLERLRSVLRPWPQLIRDFAAFLNQKQARRCGLLAEQQLFERSRRFLRRLGRSLGEGSSLYQQVVSVLQGSSAPSSADLDEVSSLLRNHPDLQQEVRHLLLLHPSPLATSTPHCNRKRVHSETGSEEEEDDKVSMMSSGEKISMWTREADRSLLMACQQGGANQNTFRQVSNQLRNKTVQQVRLRFQNLMKLFHSASRKSTSCSWPEQPISRQEAAPD